MFVTSCCIGSILTLMSLLFEILRILYYISPILDILSPLVLRGFVVKWVWKDCSTTVPSIGTYLCNCGLSHCFFSCHPLHNRSWGTDSVVSCLSRLFHSSPN